MVFFRSGMRPVPKIVASISTFQILARILYVAIAFEYWVHVVYLINRY